MSSRTLREIYTTGNGNGTGIPFAMTCLAWYLEKILGYSGTASEDTLFTNVVQGFAGEFNLTGTDTKFKDSAASVFDVAHVGRYLVVQSANSRNAGIYLITGYTDTTTITVDFKAGTTEFPTQETGIRWWVISSTAMNATGEIAAPDATGVTDGMFALLDDGQNINTQKVLILSKLSTSPAYSPNQWRGGIISPNRIGLNNTLVGQSLIMTVGSSSQTVTFTGSNPLEASDIATQINSAFSPAYTEVCYESDENGYKTTAGGYLTFRAKLNSTIFGLPAASGQPAEKPSAALNDITLTYSGSTAWTALGLTGTSNLTASNLTQVHKICDDVPPTTEDGIAIATWAVTQINSWSSWNITAVRSTNYIQLSNDYPGTHGNRPLLGNWLGTGMQNGHLPSTNGAWYRAQAPYGTGDWAIEIALYLPFTAPYLRIRSSVNGLWGAQSKLLPEVFVGSVASAANYLYAEGDTLGKWLNVVFHQATNNRWNGFMVSAIDPFDSGHDSTEKVVVMGNTSNSSTYYDGGSWSREYSTYKIGRGAVWSEVLQTSLSAYMLEPTYGGYTNGWSKWTSRERNRRRSGSQVGEFTGTSIAMSGSTATLTNASATFTTADVGKYITIYNCTNTGNNGFFIVTARLSATQIQFTNASGVNETSSFKWTMDLQDIAEGTIIVVDENNAQGFFEIYGRMQGHYTVRTGTVGGWANKKAFSEAAYLDCFHTANGIAVAWPNITPQH